MPHPPTPPSNKKEEEKDINENNVFVCVSDSFDHFFVIYNTDNIKLSSNYISNCLELIFNTFQSILTTLFPL